MKFIELSQTLSHILLFLFIDILKEQESIISRQRFIVRNLPVLHVIHFIVRERHQNFTILKDNRQESHLVDPNGSSRDRCPLYNLYKLEIFQGERRFKSSNF